MAEGVDAPLRVERGAVGRCEDDARGADGRADRARPHEPHAHRARRLIARARDDGRAHRKSRRLSARGRHTPRHLCRLERARKKCAFYADRVEHLFRPLAPPHVEDERPRSVGHVGRVLAGQAQAHVIFRQQHRAHARPDFRLALAHPEHLRERKAFERRVRHELYQALGPDALGYRATLLVRAQVAPDDRGAQRRVVPVQQNGAVHLSGEPDAGDLFGAHAFGREHRAHRRRARAPPVARVLLGPARVRRGERRVLDGRAGDDTSRLVNHERAAAARPDVDSDELHETFSGLKFYHPGGGLVIPCANGARTPRARAAPPTRTAGARATPRAGARARRPPTSPRGSVRPPSAGSSRASRRAPRRPC